MREAITYSLCFNSDCILHDNDNEAFLPQALRTLNPSPEQTPEAELEMIEFGLWCPLRRLIHSICSAFTLARLSATKSHPMETFRVYEIFR